MFTHLHTHPHSRTTTQPPPRTQMQTTTHESDYWALLPPTTQTQANQTPNTDEHTLLIYTDKGYLLWYTDQPHPLHTTIIYTCIHT